MRWPGLAGAARLLRASALAIAVLPATAWAGQASVSADGRLVFSDTAPDVDNDLRLYQTESGILFDDWPPVEAGDGCTQTGENVSCPLPTAPDPFLVSVVLGGGNDVTRFSRLTASLSQDGGAGSDDLGATNGHLRADGGEGDDIVRGGAGNDEIFGGPGVDTLMGGPGGTTMFGGPGADRFILGGGHDVVSMSEAAGVVVTLDGKPNDGAPGERDNVWGGIEELVGSAGADSLTGDVFANTIRGREGNDVIAGGDGPDTLYGDDGNDQLLAADGVVDSVDCGAGTDTAIVDAIDVVTGCETWKTAPTRGRTVNVLVVGGRVRYRLPGNAAYEPLPRGRQLPLGTILDTRDGRIQLRAATSTKGGTRTWHLHGGRFFVYQSAAPGGVVELRLAGRLTACGGAIASRAKTGRRLWGRGDARARTTGRYAAATVGGASWFVEDRCDGSTRIRLHDGSATVRDLVHNRTLTLRSPRSYLVRRG